MNGSPRRLQNGKRGTMQPDPFDRPAFKIAQARAFRRRQLWYAARIACPDYETFRTSIGAIERAVSALLTEEFGVLSTA